MIRNYLKTAIRNIWRNKSFSLINILGLAVGMAVCMLIITIAQDLRSYDRQHIKKDRIYRVITDRTSESPSSFATTPFPVYYELIDKAAGIEKAVRIKSRFWGDAQYDASVLPISGIYSEPEFLEIFDFPLKYGDAETALTAPYSIILTEKVARQFGWANENPVGKAISISEYGNFTVTGVLEASEQKTHLQFEVLVSFATVQPLVQLGQIDGFLEDWTSTNDGFVYVLMEENASTQGLKPVLDAISNERYADVENFRLDFRLQSLTSITPAEFLENDLSFSMPKLVLYFLSILGLIILVTACFNYTNLSVARTLTRLKEVGIRKVVGAKRAQVFYQFITESLLLAVFSLLLAGIILEIIIIPQFKTLFFNQFLDLSLDTTWKSYLSFFIFSLLVGVFAGFLPALYLSKFQPIQILRSISNLKVFSKLGWRKVLVAMQFIIAMVLLISVSVLYHQTQFMINADYGFNQENIVNVQLQGMAFEKFNNEISKHPDIRQVSASSLIPGTGSNQATRIKTPEMAETVRSHLIRVDEYFMENLGIGVLLGKPLSLDANIALEDHIVMNEKGIRQLGWTNPQDALNQVVLLGEGPDAPRKVIAGVMEDFKYMGLERQTESLFLEYQPEQARYANLKIQSDNLPAFLSSLEGTWNKLDPVHPIQYGFLDEQVGRSVAVFGDILKMLGFLAVLAIVITCLGLLGIATYSVETRSKEMGIRKVLGASVNAIIWILSKGLFYPLLIAASLALPLAWYINALWLESIAYRISLNIMNVGAGLLVITLIVTIILVGQALRIATRNPVDALRTE